MVRRIATTRNRKGVNSFQNRRFKKLVGGSELSRVQDEPDAWEIVPPWARIGVATTRRKIKSENEAQLIREKTFLPNFFNPNISYKDPIYHMPVDHTTKLL